MNELQGSMWMTCFLRSPDQEKKSSIASVIEANDMEIMESIRFHLGLRNQLHLLRRWTS